ncbi:MAG: hypothetical protein IT359_01905 [Gemmatimonadaceae bacterium]|nr:hypothetical protein [Gemmatimonadaceae bacterium]
MAQFPVLLLVVLALAGCASSQTVTVKATPAPADSVGATTTTSGGVVTTGASTPVSRPTSGGWQLDTREHVDLWLHGFAMLQDDQSLVPYFRLGYPASIAGVRPAGGVFDQNRAALQARFATNANLTSAQFLALYFASWDDLRRGVDRFLRDEGDVRLARSQEELRMYATIRTYFPTASDRDWLQLFVRALDDERSRFYRAFWQQEQSRRSSMRGSIDVLWAGTYRSAFQRFIRNAMQREGRVLLSLPLGGEGRTLSVGGSDNFMSVTFPTGGEDPRDALYVIAHEAVGTTATAAVRDNSSPTDERNGDVARWSALAAVRGGAMLLQRVAPELVAGYQRYYLRVARASASALAAADPLTAFNTTFPLPANIVTALDRQIDIVLGGI